VHGGVVSSAVLELFGTFSFKRKGTDKKIEKYKANQIIRFVKRTVVKLFNLSTIQLSAVSHNSTLSSSLHSSQTSPSQ